MARMTAREGSRGCSEIYAGGILAIDAASPVGRTTVTHWSRRSNEQLQNSIVQTDKRLRLWCLIAKGYTDIESDYRATKRDWLEAQQIANVLGEKQWATRASGELGLIAFLEGNPGRAAQLLGAPCSRRWLAATQAVRSDSWN